MRLRSTRIRHCRSEGAGREPARTNRRCGRTRAGVSCELTGCKPRLCPWPVSVLFSPVMDGNSGPARTAPVALVSPCRRVAYGEDHRRQVVPRLLFFSCILQEKTGGIPAAGSHRGCMPVSPALGADGNDLFLVEIDDLDAVAIGVVEIGVTAGERGVPFLGIFDQLDAARLHDRERSIEFLRRYQEGMMMSVFAGIVRIDVMGDLCQHEIAAAAFHEGIALVRAHVLAAEHLRIELRSGNVIAYPDCEMQDPDRPDRI